MGRIWRRALMKTFGQAGAGVFIVAIGHANWSRQAQFQVEVIVAPKKLREQFLKVLPP